MGTALGYHDELLSPRHELPFLQPSERDLREPDDRLEGGSGLRVALESRQRFARRRPEPTVCRP
jgi:hypothetical protein